ncbi:AMP-dependent synthetase [Kitasatospora sp. NE20-6]|uniref:AMP-binding protein n=1 Tax=Kitasatospora sp. NE20-6 TaxID=2859066 RepID=UPI0034DC3AEB
MAEHSAGPPLDAAAPAADAVNTVALTQCQDTVHRIRFRDDGGVRSLTLAELDRGAARVAARLYGTGVRAGDRVGIMSRNRIEWVLLDLACVKLGAVVAGVEPGRYPPQQVIADLGLVLLFAEGPPAREDGPRAVHDPAVHDPAAHEPAVRDLAEVGGWAEDAEADLAPPPSRAAYDPADVFAVKQTSGSTGTPKGIEATVASVNRSMAAVQEMFGHRDGDNLLVFLPVRFLQQRYWIYSALVNGHDVTLADRHTACETARATAPTVVMGVPGFYEQVKARVEAAGAPAGPEARRAAVQAELGGAVRYLWTGSAPAGRAVLEFFNDCGVPLYEGYGLNETCIVAKNHPGAFRLGSVGRVLPHKRIRFDRDGVLIVGGADPVNTRYTWSAPGASERTFLPTGEVRTFDLGHVDEDGFLYIDGRVDDIVTLSGALNILVPLVEERLRELPGVHDCAVFGDGRPYLAAVVSPTGADADPEVLAQAIDRLNTELRYEQRIYAAVVAGEQFSVDNGLLNAQFKLVRAEIGRVFADDLELVYRKHSVYNDGTTEGASVLVTAAAGRPRSRQSEE